MKERSLLAVCASVLFAAGAAGAQQVQVNPRDRTIEVTVQESIEADPDAATVTLGYKNYGSSKEAAYESNVRASKSILDAIQAAGVPDESVQTTDLQLKRTYDQDDSDVPKSKRDSTFEANQSWVIHVAAGDAQKVVDIAVAAGANDVKSVEWTLADPAPLEARAYSAALSKALSLAEHLARDSGVHLGQLLKVSNYQAGWSDLLSMRPGLVMFAKLEGVEKPSLKLFPKRVKREVSIQVVYALA
jgi:uncharacterized protein